MIIPLSSSSRNKKFSAASTRSFAESSRHWPAICWAAQRSGLYYTMGEEGSSNVYFVSTDGDIEKVTDGVHYISGISIADNGLVAATNSTFYRPSYLVTFDLERPEQITTLVDFNDDVLADIKLGEVEEIWTESSDGLRVQGWLMKPANFEPGRKYPMLLWIHGGPVSMGAHVLGGRNHRHRALDSELHDAV